MFDKFITQQFVGHKSMQIACHIHHLDRGHRSLLWFCVYLQLVQTMVTDFHLAHCDNSAHWKRLACPVLSRYCDLSRR